MHDDRPSAHYGDDYYGRPRFEKLLPHLPTDGTILDFGSNEGIFLNFLRTHGRKGLGIESDPGKVRICRERGLDAVCADIFGFAGNPENEGRFAGVLLSDFVEHFDPQPLQKLLRLTVRSLRPGGVMIIITPNSRALLMCTGGFYEPTIEHHNPYSVNGLQKFLEGEGMLRVEGGVDPDSALPVLTWHPARLARNLALVALARILCGRGGMYTHTWLVMRRPRDKEAIP